MFRLVLDLEDLEVITNLNTARRENRNDDFNLPKRGSRTIEKTQPGLLFRPST